MRELRTIERDKRRREDVVNGIMQKKGSEREGLGEWRGREGRILLGREGGR